MTQVELAELLGVTHPTIGRWESGKRSPRHAELVWLSKKLGLSLSTLVGVDEEENQPSAAS